MEKGLVFGSGLVSLVCVTTECVQLQTELSVKAIRDVFQAHAHGRQREWYTHIAVPVVIHLVQVDSESARTKLTASRVEVLMRRVQVDSV